MGLKRVGYAPGDKRKGKLKVKRAEPWSACNPTVLSPVGPACAWLNHRKCRKKHSSRSWKRPEEDQVDLGQIEEEGSIRTEGK